MKINPFRSGTCPSPAQCPYKAAGNTFDSPDNFCQICGTEIRNLHNDRGLLPPWVKPLAGLVALLLLLFWGYKKIITAPPQPPENPCALTEEENDPCLSAKFTRRNALQELRRNGEIRIVVESNAPPFNDMEEGQTTGFDNDMAVAIAQEMSIPRVRMIHKDVEELSFDNFPCAFSQNIADWFMGGWVADHSLDHLVAWSEPYYVENGLCLVVKIESGIRSHEHLKGKKVAVYDDNAAVDYVCQLGGTPKRCVDSTNNGDWIKLELTKYGMDAVVYDYPFAKSEVEEFDPENRHFRFAEFNLNSMPYSIGLPKGDDELLQAVNQAIRKIMADEARYRNIVEKIGRPKHLPPPPPGKKYVIKSGEWLSMIARDQLGDVNRWQEIWELNKSRIPNPNLIHTGDTILMPER